MSLQEFDLRTIWLSVWSQASLAHNNFLGEVHIPLANCTLDTLQEYTLEPRIEEEDVIDCLNFLLNPFFLFLSSYLSIENQELNPVNYILKSHFLNIRKIKISVQFK